jgi:Zn-dependent protease/predicted transcriptional regulator
MRHGSIIVGTFFGIQLRIHYSWLVIFALIAWSVITGYLPMYRKDLSLSVRVIAGLVVTVLFFVSVIIHEYAHSLVAKRRGLKIKRITLFLFGGASELQHEPANAKTELLMTAAGPATSLVIAALFWALWAVGRRLHFSALEIVAEPLALLNFIVGVFNLLPAYPLDGGRIFRSLIWLRTKDIVSATRIASYSSYALSYLMIAFGVVDILAGAVVSGIWLGFLGWFLHQITRLSYSQTVSHRLLESVKVRDVMNEQFVTVPDRTSIDAFLSEFVLRYKQYDFLVTDKDEIVGIIELSRLRNLSGSDRASPVSRFIVPLSKSLRLKPQDPALKALTLMQQHNLDILPVLAGDVLVGVVMTRYLDDYLYIHQARRQSDDKAVPGTGLA